jgi:peroxiredoxin
MSGVLLALRLVLIAVLAVAGAAKLADRSGARKAVRGFGVPEALSGPVAAALPLIEMAAAVLLLTTVTAAVGAALALVLMLVFSAAIARSLARGEAPDCHCFGALHSEPAGPRMLIRNLLLAALAAISLAGGAGTSATHWLAGFNAGALAILILSVALAAAVAGSAAFALRLLRRNGELLLLVDELEDALEASGLAVPVADSAPAGGLPAGTRAPAFALPNLDGHEFSLSDLRDRTEDLLLVFTDPGCGPCTALLPQVGEWQRERSGGLRVVVISRGDPAANKTHAEQHGLVDVLIQNDREISERYAVSATPSALVVAADGTIASGAHAGEDQIRALIESRSGVVLPIHRAAEAPPAPAAAEGARAPDPALRTLDGKIVRLSQRLSDDGTLVVFWNPGCGFCQRMLDSLRELDARGPGLLVVSTGDPQANRDMGLEAPILLDEDFSAGSAFAAAGTPSAVLIDAERRIASPVAVGADAVVALADRLPAPVAA